MLTSGAYSRDYDEVRAVGSLNNSSRTADQTDMAYFYAGNTPVIWNQALREIANAQVTNIAESARLFALAEWRLPTQ